MNRRIAARLRTALEHAARMWGEDSPAAALRLARRVGLAGFLRRLAPNAADPPEDRRVARLADLALRDATVEVSAALAAAGITHCVFKGAALLGGTYQPGDRAIGDVDVAVRSGGRADAEQVLATLGFRPDPVPTFPLLPARAWQRAGGAGLDDVMVDLHWGLEAVTRLLPRASHITALPDALWQRCLGAPTVPAPEDHAALLVHQLVHHDLLHLRSFVDVALLWDGVVASGGERFLATARSLGVGRAAVATALALAAEFGLPVPSVVRDAETPRARRIANYLVLEQWLPWLIATPPEEEERITRARLMRRKDLLERSTGVVGLLRDVLFPPSAYLRWRWPDAPTLWQAWRRHLTRTAAKSVRASPAVLPG